MKKFYQSVFKVLSGTLLTLFFTYHSVAAPNCATGLVPLSGGTIANPTTPFTWNAPTGTVTGYKMYLGTTPAANELLNAVTTPTTSYTYTGALTCGTTYYWKVLPYNSTGNAAGCAVQTFTVLASGDPAIFPVGSWNAYAFNSTNFTNYTGFYTATGQDFNSTSSWGASYSPSSASPNGATNYQGCSVPVDNHSVIYKRQGFTPGTYSLNVMNDDGCSLYLNGNLIYSRAAFSSVFINNVWTGNLDAGSQIEFRWADTGGGGSFGAVTFTPITAPALIPGAISGDQTLCPGNDPYVFKNVTPGSGTCGTLAYQWQQDVGCSGSWADVASATNATYDVPSGITQTTCYRRSIVDANCNRVDYTNGVTVTVTTAQQGNPAVFPLNTWNGYVYDFNVTGYTSADDNWTDYKGYFSYAGTSASDPGFYSTALYSVSLPPSAAPGYTGCQTTGPLSGVQFKRQGFPAGTYQIDFDGDDASYLYINGVLVYGRTACCAVVSNVWTGNLDASSKVEYRYKNNGGNGFGRLIITAVTPAPIDPGTVASSASSVICTGDTPPPFTSTAVSSGGCTRAGYQWQADAGSGYSDISGATNTTYAPANVTVTTSYRRKITDVCGTVAYSNVLTLTVGTPTLPTPTFGSNIWNAYVYNFATTGYTGTDDNWTDYKGYFTYNGLSFNTGNIYGNNGAPSYAPGYYGCQVGQTLSGVQLKRQGFPAGTYQIDFNSDDAGYLYVNGILVFGRAGCCTTVPNVWTGNLDANSTIDYRYKNNGSSGYGVLSFTLVTPTQPLDPGTITNTNSSTVCSGNTLPPFVSTVDATSGCYVYYQWEANTGSGWNAIAAATTKTYTASNITVNTSYRRKATDACGAVDYSNIIAVAVGAYTPVTPTFGADSWNAYVYNFSAGNPTGNASFTASNVNWNNNSGTFQTSGISATNPGFNTNNLYNANDAPSFATGYQGCQVGTTQNGVIFKRQGFPTATYQIDFTSDDAGYLYVNGVLVSSRGSAGTNTNAWTGALTTTSTVEFRYKNNGGPGSAVVTFTVTTSTAPLTPGNISGTQTICQGATPTTFSNLLSATSGCSFTYQWQNSTTSATGPWTDIAAATNGTYAPGPLTQTTYYRRSVSDGCGASDATVTRTVTVNPLPLAAGSITGQTTFCPSQTGVAYSIAAVTNATSYTWSLPTGATIASGSGTNAITVNFGTTNGTISVTPTNACGNGTVASQAVTMIPLPSAAGTFTTSSAIVCAGQSGVVYTIAAVTGATSYTWTVPSDATITSATNTNSITVTFGTAAGNVSVTPTNSCGNGTARTLAITVNNIPAAAGTMTGLSDVCKPQTGLAYSIPAVAGATSYSWALPSGVTVTGSSINRTITLNFTASSTSGNVTVTPVNACGNGTPTIYPVTVSNVPPFAAGLISGPMSGCAGTIGLVYSVGAVSGATGYTWTTPTGTVITAGLNTNSITVNLGSTSGNFRVTPTNACGNGTFSSNYPVIVNPYPGTAGAITGNTTVCSGTSQTYTIAAVSNATGYTWALPAGSVITNGTNTRSITVTMGSVSGNVTVTPTNGCGDGTSNTVAVTVNVPAGAAGAISGPVEVCKGATGIVYSIPALSGTGIGYNWVLPFGTTITSGTNTNSITVTIGSNSGNITVTPTHSCGNGANASLAVSVSTLAPAAAGTITGSAAVCEGTTGVTYSIGAAGRATGYTWTVPSGSVITAGDGTTSITVNIGSASGNVTVTPTNACGNGTVATRAVTVSAVPGAVGSITGATAVCKGQTGVTYSVAAVAGATNYTWTLPAGATITAGTGTASITVSYANVSVTSGAVNVDATNLCGTTSNSIAVTIDNNCVYTWIGVTSTEWNTGSNWSLGYAPASTNNIVIPSGTPFAPTVSATTSTAGAVTINSGATVTIGGTGIWNVYGNLTGNGSVNAAAGSTLAFKGSAAQTVTGVPALYNVQINNAAGVSVLSPLTVKGTISLLNGVLTTNSNLTINFDAGGNIAYAASDNGSISGDVTGRRDAIARTHYISAPFNGVTSAQVGATTPLYYNNYWKMYAKDFATQGWTAVINTATPMPLGTGFSLALPNTGSIVLTGSYSHNFSFPGVSYSNAAAGKFMLVGNPYPSTLDWTTIYANAVNTGGAIYYWNAANNQVSSWIAPASGTNGGTKYIPAMQSFLVATTGTGGASSIVSINNNARVLTNQSYFRTAQEEISTLKLYVKNSDGITDETIINLDESATEAFEFDKDAYKIINGGLTPSLYSGTNTDATLYSINALPFNAEQSIPLNLKVRADGNYELHCSQLVNQTGYKILLEDKLNNTFMPVDTSLTYTIAAKAADNTDRFVLRFIANITTPVSTASSKNIDLGTYENNLMLSVNGITAEGITMEVHSSAGSLVQTIPDQSITPGIKMIPLDDLPSGVYLVKFTINDTPYTGKVVIK